MIIPKVNLSYDKAADILNDVRIYLSKSELTVDKIYDYIVGKPNGGFIIKNLLKKIYEVSFGITSPQYTELNKTVLRNTQKQQNFDLLREKVFIGGIGYRGEPFTEDIPEPIDDETTLVRYSAPTDIIEQASETYENDIDKIIEITNESNIPDISEPVINDNRPSIPDDIDHIINETIEITDNVSETKNTDTEQETSSHESEPNVSEPTSDSTEPEAIEPAPETAPLENESSEAKPVSQESEPAESKSTTKSDIDIEILLKYGPNNLNSAQQLLDILISRKSLEFAGINNDIIYDYSVNNTVYDHCDIKSGDGISVSIYSETENVDTGFFIVATENAKVVMLGSFVASERGDVFSLEASEKNINFNDICFNGINYNIIWANKDHSKFFSGSLELSAEEVKYSDKTLCIDFGTSNTTAGVYTENGIRTISFIDTTSPDHITSKLCPTLVYVKEIRNVDPLTHYAEDVEYLFGYDAKKVLTDNSYNPEGDLFFEIKRWITTVNKTERICDGTRKAIVKRRDIIKAYLQYILRCAESDLKCKFRKLHFSAPVKLKNDFISFIQEYIFRPQDGYMVMDPADSIDEGVAIIYNHISEEIIHSAAQHSDLPDAVIGKDGNILIIDCGGGTTDLASCRYAYMRTDTGYDLNLETKFENGNSNFGGNNITYRIFQLLKIKLADYYRKKSTVGAFMIRINDLISVNQNDVLNEVDNCINNNIPITIYNKLDKESAKSEDILPTDFNNISEYANVSKTRKLIKRNFYYLWQLAEKIKIEFYTKTDLVAISLDSDLKNETININPDDLYFYIKNPNSNHPPLEATNKIPEYGALPRIVVNINELETLLRPDIYYLLSTLLSSDSSSFSKICLSGQSCKIDLFQDLLKEFVPGKKLRMGNVSIQGIEQSEKLKMNCVYGCIAYIRDRNYHIINANNVPVSQNIIFDVRLSRGGIGIMEKYLFKGTDFTAKGSKYVCKPFLIEQYNAEPGNLLISIYNNTGSKEIEQELDYRIITNCTEENRISLDSSDPIQFPIVLKKQLIKYSYNNLEQYVISSDDPQAPETNVIDDLISRIRNIPVENGSKKVLVFGVPNNDGYGFNLYQLVKSINASGEISYHETSCIHSPFESEVLNKSFFNGQNCIRS